MKVKMPELITIGETMVAMVPEDVGMLRYKRNLNIRIAGAESNVAMGVRKLRHLTPQSSLRPQVSRLLRPSTRYDVCHQTCV